MLSSDAESTMRWLSRMDRISLQMLVSSFSTLDLYDLICPELASLLFARSLSSMELRMRQDARRAPITFL